MNNHGQIVNKKILAQGQNSSHCHLYISHSQFQDSTKNSEGHKQPQSFHDQSTALLRSCCHSRVCRICILRAANTHLKPLEKANVSHRFHSKRVYSPRHALLSRPRGQYSHHWSWRRPTIRTWNPEASETSPHYNAYSSACSKAPTRNYEA